MRCLGAMEKIDRLIGRKGLETFIDLNIVTSLKKVVGIPSFSPSILICFNATTFEVFVSIALPIQKNVNTVRNQRSISNRLFHMFLLRQRL